MRSSVARNEYTFWRQTWMSVVSTSTPEWSSLRAILGVMPAPLAAFSPLAITKSTALVAEAGQPAQQRFPARLAEHVTDEEDVQARRPE
jgi:hypothetical protein